MKSFTYLSSILSSIINSRLEDLICRRRLKQQEVLRPKLGSAMPTPTPALLFETTASFIALIPPTPSHPLLKDPNFSCSYLMVCCLIFRVYISFFWRGGERRVKRWWILADTVFEKLAIVTGSWWVFLPAVAEWGFQSTPEVTTDEREKEAEMSLFAENPGGRLVNNPLLSQFWLFFFLVGH